MSEQFLADIIREAPRPKPRRAWYFWPALVLSAIFTGAGADSVIHDERYLAGGFLIFVGVWSIGAVIWLDGSRR